MLGYAAASQCWRAVPVRLAEWAWQRRGRTLIERAARSVPAYGRLLRIFSPPGTGIPAFMDMPRLPTCRRSYVQVFPLEQRCRQGWQRQAVAFETAGTGGDADRWPRGRDERQILREQLVSLLSSWFDARQRRTLLVVALPEAGWSGRSRIGHALQEATGLGQLRASILEVGEGATPGSIGRLVASFEQCVVLADPASAVLQALWMADCPVRRGLVSFGPLPAGMSAGLPREIQTCSVLGADEVGPLIALETPLSRTVLRGCRADPSLRDQLLADGFSPTGLYQPFPRGPWIEQADGEVLVSSWGACPVMRYRPGWRGQVVSYAAVCAALQQEHALPARQIRRLTRIGSACWKLPLLALGTT